MLVTRSRMLMPVHAGTLALEVRLKSNAPGGLSDVPRQMAIGEVAERAGMTTSRIRYYETRGLLPEPERAAGKRRYDEEVFRRLAIIDAAQRVGFTLEEIRDLLGSRNDLAHERLRQLALSKLPELDDLIARATSVRRLLKICSGCDCESIDVCRMFDESVLPLREHHAAGGSRRPGRSVTAGA
jgi:MerR family transcriptional regulator, redox-sensitive transcriptional activator SoxR